MRIWTISQKGEGWLSEPLANEAGWTPEMYFRAAQLSRANTLVYRVYDGDRLVLERTAGRDGWVDTQAPVEVQA